MTLRLDMFTGSAVRASWFGPRGPPPSRGQDQDWVLVLEDEP